MSLDTDEKAALNKLQDLAKLLDAARESQRTATSQVNDAKNQTEHAKTAVVRVASAITLTQKRSATRRKKR